MSSILFKTALYSALAAALAWQSGAHAQQTPEAAAAENAETTLDQITVVGSRRRVSASSSDTDSVAPVDVYAMDKQVEKSPQFDLAQSLQYLSPSFNSTRQTGADGADLVDSAALRGLGSDQTLVLINGKRRHTSSLVNLFGARNRGSTGTDLNTLPMLGIERIEVLRDGAAAQYGSDAIAGVLNIVTKTRPGCEAALGYGQYSRGDGENYLGSGYCGFVVGDGGHIALTGEYLDRGSSDRSSGPRIIGDTETQNKTVQLDANFQVGDDSGLYFTAGLQKRDASSGAFERGGIGSDDIPSRNSALLYPNGFVPFINGDLDDRFLTAGFKTQLGEWYADFSQSYGYNRLDYRITNTLNASIATRNAGLSPTEFDAGGFSFSQLTTNIDFTRYFEEMFLGTNLAFGAEYRKDSYEIFAGEAGSYIDADGAGGGNAGSQGFPGFQPGDEVDESRNNYALYFDAEASLTDSVTAAAAIRFEDYNDFGSTLDGKLAASMRLNDAFALRGAVSTGFRAPSLQQRYLSSTFTDFISGRPVDVVLAPNGGALASAAGIPSLTEESSNSFSLGLTGNFANGVAMTVDLYRIDIDDRIVLSGRFDQDDPTIGATLARLNVGQAQFFANAVDTKTEGLDVTFNHSAELGEGQLTSSLSMGLNRTNVKNINLPARFANRPELRDTFLSERERLFVENGAPRAKTVLGFNYDLHQWNADFKIIHFGRQTLGTFSGTAAGVPNAKYRSKVSGDIALSYAFSEATKIAFGAANIADVFPTRQDDLETDNGFIYDSVQFGLNGTSYFVRLSTKF